MDPDANLREQAALAHTITQADHDLDELRRECNYSDEGGFDEEGNDLGSVDALIEYKNALEDAYGLLTHDATRLAELVEALSEWRSKGGFDPSAERPVDF